MIATWRCWFQSRRDSAGDYLSSRRARRSILACVWGDLLNWRGTYNVQSLREILRGGRRWGSLESTRPHRHRRRQARSGSWIACGVDDEIYLFPPFLFLFRKPSTPHARAGDCGLAISVRDGWQCERRQVLRKGGPGSAGEKREVRVVATVCGAV